MPDEARDIGKYFRGGRIAIPIVVVAVILFFALGGHQKLLNFAVDETAEYLSGGAERVEEPVQEGAVPKEAPAADVPPDVEEVAGGTPSPAQVEEAVMVAEAEEQVEEVVDTAPEAKKAAVEMKQAEVKAAEPEAMAEATEVSQAEPEEEEAMSRTRARAYTASYLRDPFFSLVTAEEAKPAKLLDVSRATMVGSVWGESGIIALLEDDTGRSYALKVGDRVVNGSVISVTPASVTFSITLFGLTKTVTLELAEEGEW